MESTNSTTEKFVTTHSPSEITTSLTPCSKCAVSTRSRWFRSPVSHYNYIVRTTIH